MRQYFPIWATLRETGSCIISAAPFHHRRIIKAVIKEKDMDIGFKFQCGEQFKKARLSYTVSGAIVTFKLEHNIHWMYML